MLQLRSAMLFSALVVVHLADTSPPSRKRFLASQGVPQSCSDVWEQCGGKDWAGSTCCNAGLTCKFKSESWSVCMWEAGSCSGVWEQCGGKDWAGSTCCNAGLACKSDSEWHSQCVPEVSTTEGVPGSTNVTRGVPARNSKTVPTSTTHGAPASTTEGVNGSTTEGMPTSITEGVPTSNPEKALGHGNRDPLAQYGQASFFDGDGDGGDGDGDGYGDGDGDGGDGDCGDGDGDGDGADGSCEAPMPTPGAMRKVMAKCTGYGYPDNSPPSAQIAYCGAPPRHKQATQTKGTFANPNTFATDQSEIVPGTRIYVPYLKKYFIMEDYCAQCITDWDKPKGTRFYHFDLYMGASICISKSGYKKKLTDCESAITKMSTEVTINPPDGLDVDETPLFDIETETCIM